MEAVTETKSLIGVTQDEFAAWCDEVGQPAYRAKQVFTWIHERGVRSFDEMTNLPKEWRSQLSEQWTIYASEEVGRQRSTDGTTKILLRWPDGNTSECVLIPDDKRQTACISSQVGCPVGCTFCASGLDGLKRNLTAGEIVEQAMRVADAVAKPLRLSNVVFMGLGEPLANYGNVMQAIRILNAPWGVNIGARKITVSTVGLPTQIRKLAKEDLQLNLAISLHAPNDELRKEIIPWANRIPIDELVDAGRYYFDTTGREITLEYILLGGVNDRFDQAKELVRICRKMRCNVNLIRYNPVAGLPFERPASPDAFHFAEFLRSRGVNAHMRKSRGMDIDAACGQLRRRHEGTSTS